MSDSPLSNPMHRLFDDRDRLAKENVALTAEVVRLKTEYEAYKQDHFKAAAADLGCYLEIFEALGLEDAGGRDVQEVIIERINRLRAVDRKLAAAVAGLLDDIMVSDTRKGGATE